MPEIGQTISHYTIAGTLSKGGMGEVFFADETTLDRKVALKFLPDVFRNDPERMSRFEREDKLLVSLEGERVEHRISTHGGGQPQWERDGKRLYQLKSDGSMMAVE